ncbi:MAG: ABC transporter substrate-binding protein, partial [Thermoguttaceae bacterium]|nr:ABC transporter substrate-binding protein [Thermoguttaceae bacterium]
DEWRRLECGPARRIVCSGAGALRLVAYMGALDCVVAVESIERTSDPVAPYRLANDRLAELPVFGDGHGRDNAEFLVGMSEPPDVIIRADEPGVGIAPEILQERTGIPVVLLPIGDLTKEKISLENSLRLLGEVLNKSARAEELIAYIDAQIDELRNLASRDDARPSVYLGGASFRGFRGLDSTLTEYEAFEWLGLNNPASVLKSPALPAVQTTVSPEQVVAWNPDVIFLDLGTLSVPGASGVDEVRNKSAYRELAARRDGRVYGVFPVNSYGANFETRLITAFFVAKTVFPERLADVDFDAKADEISRFFLGTSFLDRSPERMRPYLYRQIETTEK